jgi:hypothetical protein
MHYTSNPIYLAGNKDCWGLSKGEKRQIKNGKTGLPVWEMVAQHKETGEIIPIYKLEHYRDAETCPIMEWGLVWKPWWKIGEGKERQLDAARSSAVWPEATDEELTAPGLKERLEARLPQLMKEFQEAIESLGFVY